MLRTFLDLPSVPVASCLFFEDFHACSCYRPIPTTIFSITLRPVQLITDLTTRLQYISSSRNAYATWKRKSASSSPRTRALPPPSSSSNSSRPLPSTSKAAQHHHLPPASRAHLRRSLGRTLRSTRHGLVRKLSRITRRTLVRTRPMCGPRWIRMPADQVVVVEGRLFPG